MRVWAAIGRVFVPWPGVHTEPAAASLCMVTRRTRSPYRGFGRPSAGIWIHGRVCTPGRLRRHGAVLRETPPPPRRPTFFFAARQRRRQENAPRLRGPSGCPPYGSAGRSLRKLALRAQTCAALHPPVEPSSRRVRGVPACHRGTGGSRAEPGFYGDRQQICPAFARRLDQEPQC